MQDPLRDKMEDLISIWDLMDIIPMKGRNTWTNKRVGLGHITTQLNIFLLQRDFFLGYIGITSHIIATGVSKHRPISLIFKEVKDLRPVPFHFNTIWLQDPYVFYII